MRKILPLVVLCAGAAAAPASADLRITTHVETRRLPLQTDNPILGAVSATAMAQLPFGDSRTTIGEQGARTELLSASALGPAGTVMLLRGDTVAILNPAERTYWRLPMPDGAARGALAASRPRFERTRTGQFSTIAGARAERVTFTLAMDLPLPPGMPLPAGVPTTINSDGEMWITDQYSAYSTSIALAGRAAMSALGLPPQEGLVLRHITRNSTFGFEVEQTVTEITETTAAPGLYEIPADYREVPRPGPQSPR